MTHLDRTKHIPKFGGEIWYINKTAGADTNSGKRPDKAFETIGAGISAMSDGDALSIKAGTYTETGLDLTNVAAEMWFEIGVVINPATGTALTISGASCKLTGMHKITPGALETGLAVTGAECHIEHGRVIAGAIGVLVTGAGIMMDTYACGFQTTTGFDIQGVQGRYNTCSTKGNAATIGFKINGGVDTGVLVDCTSVGHQTSGFSIATGSADWTIKDCSSGHGDGRWKDVDHANAWANFHYDDVKHNDTIFSGATTAYNIFKVTGAVRIFNIFGIIETVIPNTASTIYLQLWSDSGVDITDSPGTQLQNVVAGAILVRNSTAGDPLGLANPAGVPAVVENASFKDPQNPIDIVEDNGLATYVRCVISAALASGAIDWHCQWEPLSDDGFLEDA